jgi:hypothetical protein
MLCNEIEKAEAIILTIIVNIVLLLLKNKIFGLSNLLFE